MLGNFVLHIANHRGKVLKTVEANSAAMLKLYAMNNTTGKKTSIVMNEDTKEIVMVVLGNGDGWPRAITNKDEIEAMGICIE
jgi:hypothetical protein